MVLAQQAQDEPLGEVHVLEVVDEHVGEALGRAQPHVGPLVEQAEGAQHQVARVEAAALAQEPVVVGEEARELALPRRVGARSVIRVPGRLRQLARVRDVVVGGDHLALQHVDPLEEPDEKRHGVAADLVRAQREVVDPLEEQRQPLRPAHAREERVQAGLVRLVAQKAAAEVRQRRDVELLPRRLEQLLDAGPQPGRAGRRRTEGEDGVGVLALRGEPREAPGERLALAGPRAADHERRTFEVRDGLCLRVVQAIERIRHPALG